MLESIINILLIVFGVASASMPLIKDIKKKAPIKDKPERETLTKMGKWYVAVVALTIIFGGIKYVLDNAHQQKMDKNATDLLVGNERLLSIHNSDSLEQIIRDEKCKKDAELSEANYQLTLSKARDSINAALTKTEKSINNKADINTEKILSKKDSGKLKPAYIEWLPEPHNVCHMTFDSDNTLKLDCMIENSGDMVAYAANYIIYAVIDINDSFFILHETAIPYPQNFAYDKQKKIEMTISGFHEFNLVKRYYCVAIGEFYSDKELKNKVEFELALKMYKGNTQAMIYDVAMPIRKFIKSAIKLY